MAYSKNNPNGQASMANSKPVVIASDQSSIPVSISNLTKVEDAAHSSGDTGVFMLGVRNDADAGSLTSADLDYTPIATNAAGSVRVVGEVAHDSVDAGKPLKVGGQARTTNPTAVSDGDRANLITDKLGKVVVVGSVRELKVQQATTITSSVSETTVLTSGAAGVFHDVYGLIVANSSATACNVTFKDATAGTTRFNVYVPAGDTRGFMLPESAAHNQNSAANNWTATCSASVASIHITMMAVKNV